MHFRHSKHYQKFRHVAFSSGAVAQETLLLHICRNRFSSLDIIKHGVVQGPV